MRSNLLWIILLAGIAAFFMECKPCDTDIPSKVDSTTIKFKEYYDKALIFDLEGNYEGAIAELDSAIIYKDSSVLYYKQGELYEKLAQKNRSDSFYIKSIESFEREIECGKNDEYIGKSYYNIADISWILRNRPNQKANKKEWRKKAINNLKKSIEYYPKNARAYVLNRIIRQHIDNKDEDCLTPKCKGLIEKALEINPRLAIAYEVKAKWDCGNNTECAYKNFMESIRLNPYSGEIANAYVELGRYWENEGNYCCAYKFMDRLRHLNDPENYAYRYRNIIAKYKEECGTNTPQLKECPFVAPKVVMYSVGIGNYEHDNFDRPHVIHQFHGLKQALLSSHITYVDTMYSNVDEQSKKKNILEGIEKHLCDTLINETDLVIFYFIGHGKIRNRKMGVCPYDYKEATPDKFLTYQEIATALSKSKAGRKLCLIDACKDSGNNNLIGHVEVGNIPNDIAFITATNTGKKAWELSPEASIFSQSFLDVFENNYKTDNDNQLSLEEFFNSTKLNMLNHQKGYQNIQTPEINSEVDQELILFNWRKID